MYTTIVNCIILIFFPLIFLSFLYTKYMDSARAQVFMYMNTSARADGIENVGIQA